MCSNLLIISRKKKLNKSICLIANNSLKSRGPDKTRIFFDKTKKIFLANNILSITGKQSKDTNLIASKSKEYLISYNGEIYNHKGILKNIKFLNDTELLATLHDFHKADEIPEKIFGMFAYIIYDKKQKNIVSAVDTQGEKNLFYYKSKDFFIISSTIKSILIFLRKNNVNLNINKDNLRAYFFSRHYMPILDTAYKNIKILNNGKFLNFNIKKFKLEIKSYEDPLNWISENYYKDLKNLPEERVINKLNKLLKFNAKSLIPEREYGSICSGGIDSTIQTLYLSKYKKAKKIINVNHINKDKIVKRLDYFEKVIKNKIEIIKMSPLQYLKNSLKCSSVMQTPFYTHDLPSRLLYSSKFKKHGCKVVFVADGVDELLFSQQVYLKVFNSKSKKNKNLSPYSGFGSYFLKDKFSLKYKEFLKKFYKKVYNKYSFIKNLKERSILSSLFCDYFIQSVNVANKSNDLISSSTSIETRNIFVQKNILKFFINLPFIYRYNKKADKGFRSKYILKKIFLKNFTKSLVLEKEGFSGFPEFIDQRDNYIYLKKILNLDLFKQNKMYYDKENYTRDKNWKISNIVFFLSKIKKV